MNYFDLLFFIDNGFTLSKELIQHTLVTNSLTDVHLTLFSKIINCSIVIFNGQKVEVYGVSKDDSTPIMLLTRSENKLEPVVNIVQ